MHHPGYRERYADNLKRELPRIPLAPDFRAFAAAGEKLAHGCTWTTRSWSRGRWSGSKRRACRSRTTSRRCGWPRTRRSLAVNDSLTLAGIPAEVFEYRLGNRSALEWVVDQYQVSEDKRSGIRSDPNRADDPEYIVRLVGQVVRVSIETVRIVNGLPVEFGAPK